MARVGWSDAGVRDKMPAGWGENTGWSVLYSPEGVAADRNLINMDLGTGTVYDRGFLAPPGGRTLSLVPANYGWGDDSEVEVSESIQWLPDPDQMSMDGMGSNMRDRARTFQMPYRMREEEREVVRPGVGDDSVGYGQTAEELLAGLDDTPTEVVVPTAADASAAASAASTAPGTTAPGWPEGTFASSPVRDANGHQIQYAVDGNTGRRMGIMYVDTDEYGPDATSQANAKAALAKPASATGQRTAQQWINKRTLPNKMEVGQDPETKEWFYTTPQGKVGKWDANKGQPADGGSSGADYGQGGGSASPLDDLKRYGKRVEELTGNPQAGLFAMAQAMKEGTAGGRWPVGPTGDFSATYNYGGWGGVPDNQAHKAYKTPEDGAQGYVDWLRDNSFYKDTYAAMTSGGTVADIARTFATGPAGVWAGGTKNIRGNPEYANGILAAYKQLADTAGQPDLGPAAPRTNVVPPGPGSPGTPGNGGRYVEYVDSTGAVHVRWEADKDRTPGLHYGTDDEGQFSYDPVTGEKKYFSKPGLGKNVVTAGDSLVELSGEPGNIKTSPIFRAPPTYQSDTFAGGLYSFNPQEGTHTLEVQGPYETGNQLFVPQDMAAQLDPRNLGVDLQGGSTRISDALKGYGTPGMGDDGDMNPFYGWGDDMEMDGPMPPVPPAAVEGMGTKPGEVGLLGKPHQGIDVQAQKGTPVMAPEDGTIHIEEHATGGLVVYVIGRTGKRYKMAHLDAANVQEGQEVLKGQPIATVGESGTAVTGPNLHFEMQNPDGSQRNPEEALGGMVDMPMSPNTVGHGEDTAFALARVPQVGPDTDIGWGMPQQPMMLGQQPGMGDDYGEGSSYGNPYGVGAVYANGQWNPPNTAGNSGYSLTGAEVPYVAGSGLGYVGAIPSAPASSFGAKTGKSQLGYDMTPPVTPALAQKDQLAAQLAQQKLQAEIAADQQARALEQAIALGYIQGQPTLAREGMYGGTAENPTLDAMTQQGSIFGKPTVSAQALYGGTEDNPTLAAQEAQGFVFGKPTTVMQQMYQNQLMSALNNPWVQNLTGMAPGYGLPGGAAAYGGEQYGPNPIVSQVGGGDDDIIEGEFSVVGWGDAPSPQLLAQNAATPTGGMMPTPNAASPASAGPSSFGVQSATPTNNQNMAVTGNLGFEQPLAQAFSGTAPQQSAAFQNSGSMTGWGAPSQGNGVPYALSQTGDPRKYTGSAPMLPEAPAASTSTSTAIVPMDTATQAQGIAWAQAQGLPADAGRYFVAEHGRLPSGLDELYSWARTSGYNNYAGTPDMKWRGWYQNWDKEFGGPTDNRGMGAVGAPAAAPASGGWNPMNPAPSDAARAGIGPSGGHEWLTGFDKPATGPVVMPEGAVRWGIGTGGNYGWLNGADQFVGNSYALPGAAPAQAPGVSNQAMAEYQQQKAAYDQGIASQASGAVPWQVWQNWTPFEQAAWLTKNMAAGYGQPQVLAAQQRAFADEGVRDAPELTQMTYGTLSPLQQEAYANTASVFGMTPQQWLARQQRNWSRGYAAPVAGAIGWA